MLLFRFYKIATYLYIAYSEISVLSRLMSILTLNSLLELCPNENLEVNKNVGSFWDFSQNFLLNHSWIVYFYPRKTTKRD